MVGDGKDQEALALLRQTHEKVPLEKEEREKVRTSPPLPMSHRPSRPHSLFLPPSASASISPLCHLTRNTKHEQETSELRAAHSVEFAREMAALPDDADAAAAEQVRLPIELARARCCKLSLNPYEGASARGV